MKLSSLRTPKHAAMGAAVLVMLLLPQLVGNFVVSLFNDIGIAALVVIGLVLLSGVGGATSFGQAAFVGIAAYASAWLTTNYALSPWLGLALALFVTCFSALLIGLLTLRLGGHYLPLSTIAWGLSISLLFGNIEALGRHSGLSNIPPISVGGWQLSDSRSVFYLVWLMVGLVATFCYALLNSRMGRVIRGLRGGGILLASFGADAFRVRLSLLVLSAFFAAIAGWLYAHINRFVSPSPFSLHASIDYMFMMVSGGLGQLSGAILGSGLVHLLRSGLQDLLPKFTAHGSQIEPVVVALLFILLLHYARGGVNGYLARWRRGRALTAVAMQAQYSDTKKLSSRTLPTKGDTILEVHGATNRFGGLVAVNEVGFSVQAGEIIGLIGPNGAGKSTMFNLLTGVLPLSAGNVRFLGQDITGKAQRSIALMGMARTFQHVKLRPHMSLLENVALGAHARGSCGILRGGLAMDGAEERLIFAEARHQLARIGLEGREHELASSLPLGTQRLLEIARALAADPALLILDEPAAGLRRKEKLALGDLLRRLRDDGVTILIVEHDMDFVMKLVNRLVVMNFGTKLCEGTPEQVRTDPKVQAAYLGGHA